MKTGAKSQDVKSTMITSDGRDLDDITIAEAAADLRLHRPVVAADDSRRILPEKRQRARALERRNSRV